MVVYEGCIFRADSWSQVAPGKQTKPSEGWAVHAELYHQTTKKRFDKMRIIGYLPTWRLFEKFDYSDKRLYQNVTHVVVSFLTFDEKDLPKLTDKDLGLDEKVLSKIMQPANECGTKVMVAIGGGNNYAFNLLMAKIGKGGADNLLNRTVEYIVNLVQTNSIDGIDLDLECWWGKNGDSSKDEGGRMKVDGPSSAGKGLLLLIIELRKQLPEHKFILSAAVPGSSWYGNNYDSRMADYLDWLGIMSYDFTGSWNNSPVGPHTACFRITDQERYMKEQQEEWPGGGVKNNPIMTLEDSLWYWTNPFYVNWQGEG
jgi:GH18 family chitinase